MMKLPKALHLCALAVPLAFALGCGGAKKETKAQPPPPESKMSDEEAMVGEWRSGEDSLTLTDKGRYVWKTTRSCSRPPCPETKSNGSYEFRGKKLYLDPEEGGDMVLGYQLSWEPRTVKLHSEKEDRTWTYTYASK